MEFSILDIGCNDSWENIFKGNQNKEKILKKLGDWDYIAYGEIIEILNHDAIVDCGGFLLPLANLTSDKKCIGEFVKFEITRLDVEKII